ncbi:hypothetical protein [Streptomyces venezuelae]|uniref:hypothetical protein n=1 Tax=Streptomyces venezuelae TaxID=54571 RepID=UPI00123BF152|nr:hypothetical protein [Streptomyces venezuelae]QES06614.1 hypothetical protein DEJ44_13990 [Streptomyces venezuelae]
MVPPQLVLASDPWQGHDVGGLFVGLFAGAAVLVGLTVYLASRLAPANFRRYTPVRVCRDVSLLAVALGSALYLWGLFHLLLTDEQDQAEECELRRPAGVARLVGLRGDFVPLRLVCETPNGHDYDVVVPGYINPSLTVLLLLALAGAVAAGLLHRGQRSSTRKKG